MEFLITRNDDAGRGASNRAFLQSPFSVNIALAYSCFRLVGAIHAEDIAVHLEETRGLILIGTHRATPEVLARELSSYAAPSDVFDIFRRIPGSYFTILTWGKQLYVQGTLAGTRRVMIDIDHAMISNDGSVLRRALNAELARENLPLLLMVLQPPSLLNNRTPWRGISGVAQTFAAHVTTEGQIRLVRRWTPPSPTLPIDQVAPKIDTAIRESVEARHGAGPISSDLSGGMDSTTLAFYAYRHSTDLVTVFRPGIDPSNDDAEWTSHARRSLSRAQHLEIPADANMPWYSEWLREDKSAVEAPLPSSRTSGYLDTVAQSVSQVGSRRHMTGIGGDELFHASYSLIRQNSRAYPWWAWRAAQNTRAMGRWTLPATVQSLYARETLAQWKRRAAKNLTLPPAVQGVPPTDWEPRPLLPEWATNQAIEQVRETILLDAHECDSGFELSDHETLSLIGLSGSLIRRFEHIFQAYGISYEAPLLDDSIVELALSILPTDRIQGSAYKPVLATAGQHTVPVHLLGRQTKGDYSREAFTGMKYSRPGILDEFENSELAQCGLIDIDRFRAALTGVHSDTRVFQFLDPTLTTEAWLRRVSQPLKMTGAS